MSRIEGYNVYQSSYYENATKSKKAKDTAKEDKTEKIDKRSQVQLSDRAKKLLEELKKTYGNMDFMVADYDNEEEAAKYLSRGTKEYSVLIEPELLEEMAADKETKEKYLGILDDATGKLAEPVLKEFAAEMMSHFPGLCIRKKAREAWTTDTKGEVQSMLELSPMEYALLIYLAEKRGELVLYQDLFRSVWQTEDTSDVRTVMVHVSNLRKKMGDCGKLIHTVRSAGYIFKE